MKAGQPKVNIDKFSASAVRLVVQSFFRVGNHPTLNKALAKCWEEIIDSPDIGRTSLWKLMKSIGFRYCKTRGNRKIMIEKPDILAWRHRYLHQVRELSASASPIVFLNETRVNSHHNVGRKWCSDSSKAGDPIRKRRLLVRANA